MLLSIIIPVRNPDYLLQECLESLAQTRNIELEIIVVLDHGPDEMPDIGILDSLNIDSLRVVNPGSRSFAGGARNYGIQQAKGLFIAFVDADDLVTPELFPTLIHLATAGGHDIVASGFDRLSESDGKRSIGFRYSQPKVLQKNLVSEFINRYPRPAKRLLPASWGKVFRRELFDRWPDPFASTSLYEDLVAMLRILSVTDSMLLSAEVGYLYRVRSGSISRSFSSQHVDWTLNAHFDIIHPMLFGSNSHIIVSKRDYYRFLHQQSRDFMGLLCARTKDGEEFDELYSYLLGALKPHLQSGAINPLEMMQYVDRAQWQQIIASSQQLTQWKRVRDSLPYRAWSHARRAMKHMRIAGK
ncbi:glycosyltransferase family 2 protein [Gammaproteobacteria bacterium]|nr:glycosyltransferase family 2 protein [Gammaproteobacteria bacterium]